jgi:hypothetical protein
MFNWIVDFFKLWKNIPGCTGECNQGRRACNCKDKGK